MSDEQQDRVVDDLADQGRVLEEGRLLCFEEGRGVGRADEASDDTLCQDSTQRGRRAVDEDGEGLMTEPGSKTSVNINWIARGGSRCGSPGQSLVHDDPSNEGCQVGTQQGPDERSENTKDSRDVNSSTTPIHPVGYDDDCD